MGGIQWRKDGTIGAGFTDFTVRDAYGTLNDQGGGGTVPGQPHNVDAFGLHGIAQFVQLGFVLDVAWIGGNMEDYVTPYEHLKVALFEQHNMAGNVFALSPYQLVAYHRNTTTLTNLKRTMEISDAFRVRIS